MAHRIGDHVFIIASGESTRIESFDNETGLFNCFDYDNELVSFRGNELRSFEIDDPTYDPVAASLRPAPSYIPRQTFPNRGGMGAPRK